jgi:hypothetical protein
MLDQLFGQAEESAAFHKFVREFPDNSVLEDRAAAKTRFAFQQLSNDRPCFLYTPGERQRCGVKVVRKLSPGLACAALAKQAAASS